MIKNIKKIFKRFTRKVENIQFKIFSNLLKKYNVDFFYKDKIGILTKRSFNDNFQYIFKTQNSCDAVPLMEALTCKIKNSKVCIDVGANIGIVTIWMAKNCEKVYSFEPEENNILRFRENLEANNIKNVELVQKAVSDQNSNSLFFLFDSYGHHSLSDKHVSSIVKTTKVETVRLDSFIAEMSVDEIDFLKIDTEGYELEVLKGAVNLLQDHKIKIIAFEHSPVLLKKQNRNIFEVIDFLKTYDYSIFRLNGEKINEANLQELGQEDLYATHI